MPTVSSVQQPAAPNPQQKTNLLGMSPRALVDWFEGQGEKRFRAGQMMKWLYHRGVADFALMTDFSRALRERLESVAEVRAPEVAWSGVSADGTRKWLIRVAGGNCVETVFIPDGKRGTLCVSSQVGCSLDCSFCSTGKQGFNRNLDAAEIVGQVWIAQEALRSAGDAAGPALTNIVFMGMGEPLLNLDHVVDAIHVMTDDLGYGLSKRRVTVSTAGVVPGIRRLAAETDVSLAISLHAPTDELRNELVPVNRKYPIAVLLDACRDFLAVSGARKSITVEYTLIDGVNDSPEQARELARVLKDFPCKVNLIPFNPFDLSDYRRPSGNRVRNFHRTLMDAGYIVTIRTTRGDDISAACGQLVGQVQDRTRRSTRYIALQAVTESVPPTGQPAVWATDGRSH